MEVWRPINKTTGNTQRTTKVDRDPKEWNTIATQTQQETHLNTKYRKPRETSPAAEFECETMPGRGEQKAAIFGPGLSKFSPSTVNVTQSPASSHVL
ncbi:hypothetical protein J6590_075960 [Homalodisca vitripennis]|nr:hypothetical protein J6590_075960 [Homalodisca vitripennis]